MALRLRCSATLCAAIDLATLAAGRLDRQSPLKLDPLDEYLTTWPARLPLVTDAPLVAGAATGAAEPVQM